MISNNEENPNKISIVDYSDSRGSLQSKYKDIEREGQTFPNDGNKQKKIFNQKVVPERLDINQEFLDQIPSGNVKLTRQQREKLIQVLRTHDSEEDDILLTLNKEQTEDLVRQNLGKPEVCVNINEIEFQKGMNEDQSVRLYPRDFYPLVEKHRLQNSEIREIPKKNLEMAERRPMMLRKPISEVGNKNDRFYSKDMLELVEEAQEKGELSAYPQEILDLMQAIGETNGDPDLIERAQEIFPEEMMDLVEKQPERHKFGEDILFPEEIFEVGDQEKMQGERVSFFAKELLDLVNKEARENEKALFPKRLVKTLDDKYSRVIHLEPEQREHAIAMLSDKGSSQVVISPEERINLLQTLTDHKEKEVAAMEEMQIDPNDPDFALNDDMLGPCLVELSPEQVLDVLNQNVMVDGIPLDLTAQQAKKINHEVPSSPVLQGVEYYDGCDSRLVDGQGNNICLDDLSNPGRSNLLRNLQGKRLHVGIAEPKKVPRAIEEVFFDPSIDCVVDSRGGDKFSLKDIDTGPKLNNLRKIEKKNLRAMPSALQNQTYYDALVDELVDKDGDRHNLKDLTLREVEDLIAENEAEEIPVIIQPDGKTVSVLDNVRYLPIEDSLTDQKNRKTILTDLTPDERLSLMEALGERKGVKLGSKNGSPDSKQQLRAMFGSRQQRELDQVMERMLDGDAGSPTMSWKQNYSRGIQPKGINKKTVKKNGKKDGFGSVKKSTKSDKKSVKSGKSKKTKKSGKSGKSKKSRKTKKSKPETVEEEYLNTIKSKKGKKKKKPIESVVVTNLRNSSKNPLLTKLMSEDEPRKKKKTKKKKGDKANSVQSSTTKKSKKNSKKSKKFLSEPNNLLDKDPDEPNNEMNTFVEAGSLDEISYDADYSQNKSDSDILEDVINEAREEEERDEYDTMKVKEDILPENNYENENFIDPDQTLGNNTNSGDWANYSDSDNKREKYDTFNQNAKESQEEEMPDNILDDTKTEKTVPKVSGNTFTNELLVQELESTKQNESSTKSDKNISENMEASEKEPTNESNLEENLSRKNSSKNRNAKNMNEFMNENLNEYALVDEESFHVKTDHHNKQFNKVAEESFNRKNGPDSGFYKKVLIDDESGNVSGLNNSQLRNKIQLMFNEEKKKLGFEIMKKCESMIIKRANKGEIIETEVSDDEDGLLNDFHTFCREKLPTDPKYKESMMFVSMFYYFLDRRGMLKKRILRKKK